jgi:Asp-tRNA(Asn)/Glu-tRNA(Gln) amidotransferase A subunit family amidase
LEVTEQTNCVVDFIMEARNHAIDMTKVPVKARGPFYGLPISVKECHFVKGYDATAGLARQINSPAQEDGPMVKVGRIAICIMKRELPW